MTVPTDIRGTTGKSLRKLAQQVDLPFGFGALTICESVGVHERSNRPLEPAKNTRERRLSTAKP